MSKLRIFLTYALCMFLVSVLLTLYMFWRTDMVLTDAYLSVILYGLFVSIASGAMFTFGSTLSDEIKTYKSIYMCAPLSFFVAHLFHKILGPMLAFPFSMVLLVAAVSFITGWRTQFGISTKTSS